VRGGEAVPLRELAQAAKLRDEHEQEGHHHGTPVPCGDVGWAGRRAGTTPRKERERKESFCPIDT